jgi:ubiquinone/menaquinone biosynthesis C-methylase UbiE
MKMPDPLFLSLNEGYNRWAEFYDADDNPLHLLEETVVDEALGDVRGKAVLDLGCGTGRQTLRLAAKGARVTGVDQSEGMLEKAKAKDGAGSVQFLHLNLDEAFPFADASYDVVVSFLVLEHLADLGRFFSHCRRVCQKSGFLCFTAMHPAMVLRGVQARYTEASGRKVYPKGYPYQISDYVNAAIGAGLRLARITEHTADVSLGGASRRARKYEGWPLLLTLTFYPQ